MLSREICALFPFSAAVLASLFCGCIALISVAMAALSLPLLHPCLPLILLLSYEVIHDCIWNPINQYRVVIYISSTRMWVTSTEVAYLPFLYKVLRKNIYQFQWLRCGYFGFRGPFFNLYNTRSLANLYMKKNGINLSSLMFWMWDDYTIQQPYLRNNSSYHSLIQNCLAPAMDIEKEKLC